MNLSSTRYAFTSAFLKSEEAGVISSEHIDGIMQRARTMSEVLEVIKNTDMGEYLQDVAPNGWETFDEMDSCLWRYFGICIDRLEHFKLPPDMTGLLDGYIKKFDTLNVKTALRGVLTGRPFPVISVGVLHQQGYLDELSNATSQEELADILVKINLSDYASVVNDIKEKDIRSLLEGEFKLDNLYYQKIHDNLRNMYDGIILTAALEIIIDLSNLQIVFRSVLGEKGVTGEVAFDGGHILSGDIIQDLLSLKASDEITNRLEHTEYHQTAQEISRNYEKEKTVTVIDKIIEKYKFRMLNDLLSPRALSPCNLFWYLFLKELEIRNIRLIFKTLLDGIPSSEIRDYLVTVS